MKDSNSDAVQAKVFVDSMERRCKLSQVDRLRMYEAFMFGAKQGHRTEREWIFKILESYGPMLSTGAEFVLDLKERLNRS